MLAQLGSPQPWETAYNQMCCAELVALQFLWGCLSRAIIKIIKHISPVQLNAFKIKMIKHAGCNEAAMHPALAAHHPGGNV